LADVLERRGKVLAGEDEEAFQKHMRRLARVADTRLGDPDRALEAWRAVSEMMPEDKEALGALTRLYYEQEDWEGVCEVLRRQIPLADDPKKVIGLSLRLADILDEHLSGSLEAVDVLESLLQDVDPTHAEVMARLRKLYVDIGEPAKAVGVAEQELALLEDPTERHQLSLEIAAAWRDEVGDDEQAIAAYEKVLDEQPASREALSALVVLYTRTGRWEKLIETNKLLFDFADNDRERLRLLFQIAEVYEERLEEPEKAFEWYRRAYELFPQDRGTLTSLERAAAENDLWEPLIEVYEEMRARSQHPSQHLEIAAKIARIREHEMGQADLAFDVLRGALVVDLTGEEFLPELERLAEEYGRWDDLVEIYERVLRHQRATADRIALLHKSAAVLEDELADLKAALGRIRRAFKLDPSDVTTADWMIRLSEQLESWDDLLAVHSARYSAAATLEERLDLVRQSAKVVEEKVGDKIKAFRAYLHGFLIDPEHDDILAALWRLAEEIGVYDEHLIDRDLKERQRLETEAREAARHRKRKAKKRADAQEKQRFSPSSLSGGPVFMDGEPSPAASPFEKPDVTQELDLADLEIMGDDEPAEVGSGVVRDPTVQISLSDMLEIEAVRTGEVPLLEASSEFELLDKVEGGKKAREAFGEGEDTGKHMLAGLTGNDLPPARSAWEEFARAYAMLPAPDVETKRHYCHRIAAIWRDGARDLRRAFEALRWALELDVMADDTRAEIEEVAREGEMLGELTDLLSKLLEHVHGMETLVFLNREVARLCEDLGQMQRAEKHYKSILSIKPDFRPAFERLQEIYRDTERWEDLAALDERQMEDLLDNLPAGPEREAKLRELATLYEEKLDQPYEAMEAWTKVLSMHPDDVEAYTALARLGAKTASWARAVEALGHLEELAQDEEEVLACRRRMARIYKNDLELPDRAIDLYTQILNLQPEDSEALENLDTLYETHEAWDELEKILELRARLTEDEEKWAQLTSRRAEVLSKRIGDASAAANCYEELRAAYPEQEAYAEASIRLLREAGRIDDALTVFDERLEAARGARATSGQIAALLVRKANMLNTELGNLQAARELLEEALELVPDYPSALGELARLHRDEEDWPAYVEARVREAEAAAKDDDCVTAYVEAGTVYQKHLSKVEQAYECFQKALEKDPQNIEALSALAKLAEQQGHWQEVVELRRQQVEIVEEPAEKAELFVAMAKAHEEGLQDRAEAEQLYKNALALDRDNIVAITALADLYYGAERWEEAKSLMEDALQRLEGEPELAAKLGYRLAGLYKARGEANEAYKFLRDLDRRNPNNFLLKLALGENRFAARRWREAAKILTALGEHEKAGQYPAETARALCMAAEAETHQRRPGKAPPLWKKALEFKPDSLEAINALVKYHTDRGALDDAATYLQAKAEATTDAETKVQLWDSLGDLYHDKLEDDGGALSCYTEALEAAEPIEKQHLPILEKVFPLCRAVGDDEQAARVIGFILAFTEDPELRAPREVQAADAYVALGDHGRAIEHLEAALELDPNSEPAVNMLVDIYEQKGDYRQAADLLSDYLGRLEETPSDPAEWSRRAALHERLADLYQHGLEDPPAAIEILEKALELDPTRLSCRSRLAELYGDADEFEEKAFYNHQALVADDIGRHTSLNHLARIYKRRGELDKALCVSRVLEVQKRADIDALGFIAEHSPAELPVDGRWPGALHEEDRDALAHEQTLTMGEVFATIWEGAPALFGGGLERFGLSAKDRISPVADMDLARVYGAAARALGNRLTGLYLSWTGDFQGVNIRCHAPPLIVVGPDAEEKPVGELRFLLGRALELTRPEYILAAGLEPAEFNALFAAVLRAFHPRHSRRKLEDTDPISRRAKQLKKDLPYRVSRKLVDLLQEKAHVEFNSAVWRSAVRMSGNRAGLLVCGELKSAVRVLLAEDLGVTEEDDRTPEQFAQYMQQSETLRDLLSFAVSEDYFGTRKRLGQDVVFEESA
jgi:tetratricopeptide (TPR) repeat protein